MTNQSTPGDIFADLLRYNNPSALAWVRGGEAVPALSGLVKFYETPYQGVLVEAEIFNLPNKSIPGSSDFYAFHIPSMQEIFRLYLEMKATPGLLFTTNVSPSRIFWGVPSSFTAMRMILKPSPPGIPAARLPAV